MKQMAGYDSNNHTNDGYDFGGYFSSSAGISGSNISADSSGFSQQTNDQNNVSETRSSEYATVWAILEKCRIDMYPRIENFTEEDKLFAICDYCPLSEHELDVLYSDLTCVDRVYYPITVFGVLFGLVFVLGLSSNLLVIRGLRTGGRALSSAMYMFITNVAVGDLLIVLICLPFTVTSTMVFHYWPFGKPLCMGVSYLQAVSVFVSSYSLVAVAFDRYVAIIYPLRPRITRLTTKVVIGIIWMLAFITCIPVCYYSELVVPGEGYNLHHDAPVCQEVWPVEFQKLRRIYALVLLLLHYFLPVTVMVFTYTRIVHRVWCSKESQDVRRYKASTQLSYSFSTSKGTLQRQSSSSSTKGGAPNSPSSPSIPGQSPAKLVCMTVTVVSVYSLCWLPFNVFMVLQEFNSDIYNMRGIHYIWAGIYFLAMLHTVFNVILLYWFNLQFRYSVLKLLCKLLPCCRLSLESRLHRLSSFHLNRKSTFNTSHGSTNCTLMVRQSGSLQRRYHRSHSDRGNSVTRTLSTRTVEESLSMASIPRGSNNHGMTSPNDLTTLYEMSPDAVSDLEEGTVIVTSFATASAVTTQRGSAGVSDPVLKGARDTVTTDDDCPSEMGDRGNRGTFSDTDEVFLPDEEGNVIPDKHFSVTQETQSGDEEELLGEQRRNSYHEYQHQKPKYSDNDGSDASSEQAFKRGSLQDEQITPK